MNTKERNLIAKLWGASMLRNVGADSFWNLDVSVKDSYMICERTKRVGNIMGKDHPELNSLEDIINYVKSLNLK